MLHIIVQLANCGENYKFSVYPYSILQEFTVNTEVIVTSHPEIVRKSHAWRTGPPRVLMRLALMTNELDIPWDPGISSVFIRDDASLSTICALIELPSFTTDPSRRSAPPLLPWSRCDALVLISQPPP